MAKTNFNTLAGLSIAVNPQIVIKLKSCDVKFDMKFENHSHLHSVYPCLDTVCYRTCYLVPIKPFQVQKRSHLVGTHTNIHCDYTTCTNG